MRYGVWKSWWAQSASGFRSSVVWDFPILRDPLAKRGRGTTAPLFRAKRDLLVSPDTGAMVVLDYAVPGSAGGRSPPLAWNAGVAALVVYPVPLGKGKCGLRVPRRSVALLELVVCPRWV